MERRRGRERTELLSWLSHFDVDAHDRIVVEVEAAEDRVGAGHDRVALLVLEIPEGAELILQHRFVATGRAGGWQQLMRIVPEHRVIEVGYVYWGPTIARTRLATEAIYLTARHVFETLGYRRFEWKCNALNQASRRAALRFGFVFEGIFRQHMIARGQNRDTAWFAMLDGDWPRLKAEYERWLEPENFDAAGGQRTKLST